MSRTSRHPQAAVRRLAAIHRAATHRARRALVVASAEGVAGNSDVEKVSIELPSADVKAAVQLARLRQGSGYAIVIAAVKVGSQAAAAGVRPGQALLEISDPIRPREMWKLDESSSLQYVREALRMRVPQTTTLLLSAQPIPEWGQAVAAARAAAVQAAQPVVDEQVLQEEAAVSSTPAVPQEEEGDLLTNIALAVSSGESFDDASEQASAGNGAAGGQLTVAEKLEQRYQQQQEEGAAAAAATQQPTAQEKRQQRRKEYFDQDTKRNDGPFFASVALLFILPPAIILIAAFATGYLDQLAEGQLR
ncbi:hypothetical protein D9Q98_002221 [Chlorella vulgaris]|uniref:PDZ domain-containing protein n=1 Tax=Chlorella vulgaris TaxID=3077 RepID=A0A9D4TVU7_CHLVU|nr:hypothetical protein D9Q98_002221 [Chlorella vulgaris]